MPDSFRRSGACGGDGARCAAGIGARSGGGGRDRHSQRDRYPASADDRFRCGPAADRAIQHAFAAADSFGADSGAVLHRTRHHGLRRFGRSGRPDVAARHRRSGAIGRSDDRNARVDRRSPAVYGAVRPSDIGRIPVADGRAGRGAARSGIGSLRLERYGRSREHRHAQDARRRREELFAYRLRFLQYVAVRTDQPDTQGTLHERRQRLLQPDRRASGEHGLRAVRRLCQAGL